MRVKNFGPIKDLDIDLGDLTILIGPQASGKTLFLQMLKLLVDKKHIVDTLVRYNYVIGNSPDNLLDCYFGDRLSSLWRPDTYVEIDGAPFPKESLIAGCGGSHGRDDEKVFYIPAQRILSISDGRPKNFMEYDISTPYILRNFSETLRLFFQHDMGDSQSLFPVKNRLRGGMEKAFDNSIFHGGEVVIDRQSGQNKMRLSVDGASLPFMAWSAGQKEFMPLLMAAYCIARPASGTLSRKQYEYVVIEEPEMGLHPRAIQALILQMLEFIDSGYKVIVSTHSPVPLEFAWAYRAVRQLPRDVRKEALCRLFSVGPDDKTAQIFDNTSDLEVKTYYFAHTPDGVVTSDISPLDPSSMSKAESDWGGLSQFATDASEVVSEYAARYGEPC